MGLGISPNEKQRAADSLVNRRLSLKCLGVPHGHYSKMVKASADDVTFLIKVDYVHPISTALS